MGTEDALVAACVALVISSMLSCGAAASPAGAGSSDLASAGAASGAGAASAAAAASVLRGRPRLRLGASGAGVSSAATLSGEGADPSDGAAGWSAGASSMGAATLRGRPRRRLGASSAGASSTAAGAASGVSSTATLRGRPRLRLGCSTAGASSVAADSTLGVISSAMHLCLSKQQRQNWRKQLDLLNGIHQESCGLFLAHARLQGRTIAEKDQQMRQLSLTMRIDVNSPLKLCFRVGATRQKCAVTFCARPANRCLCRSHRPWRDPPASA